MKKVLVIITLLAMLIGTLGGITVIAEETSPSTPSTENTLASPTLEIKYFNLLFGNNVYIKYAVVSDLAPTDVKLLVWTASQLEYTYGTQSAVLTYSDTENIDGTDCIVFDYADMTAKQMTDEIYAVAYAVVDGTEHYSEVKKYSILKYAYDILGKTAQVSDNEALKAMITQMLAYGATAQTYFDYKADRLSTEDFYQVTVKNGTLEDGTNYGLYREREQVIISAPETNSEGFAFKHWVDGDNTVVSEAPTVRIEVSASNNTYTAVYANGCEHNEVIDAAIAATCTTPGKTEGRHCDICGAVIVPQTMIPPSGHNIVIVYGVEPTCTTAGMSEGKECDICGEVTVPQTMIPPSGHGIVIDYAIEATCTNPGMTEGQHCWICGEVLVEQTVIPPTGHTNIVIDEAVAPTCTSYGLTEGKHCEACGQTIVVQMSLNMLEHSIVVTPAIAPTCDTNGRTAGEHCDVCGLETVSPSFIPALGHNIVIDAAVAPTATTNGLTEGSHCSVCELVIQRQEIIPALGNS